MLLTLSSRDVFLECVPKGSVAVELGVFTGDHAAQMLSVMQCSELHLVDYWTFAAGDHNPLPDTPAHLRMLEEITMRYMGSDPAAKLEQCFAHVTRRFSNDARVHIHRLQTHEAVSQFEDGKFDVIYLDANHQYEYVLRDLLEYAPKLKRGGIIILNDHFDGPDGRNQNLGVIGATSAFMKRTDFTYLAMTATPWSDLVITNDASSDFCMEFIDSLLSMNVEMIEIPAALVPTYSHSIVTSRSGVQRHLPSFDL